MLTVEITKAEFKRLLSAELIMWPPVVFDGKVWGKRVMCEDNPAALVWCTA